MTRIEADHARTLAYPSQTFAPTGDPENLVGDLGAALRAQGLPDFVPSVSSDARPPEYMLPGHPPETSVSIDAIAATVRDTFSRWPPAPTHDAGLVVAGAVLLAMAVADDPEAPEYAGPSLDPTEIKIQPPWRISHPVLLDPIMWLVVTAYYQA